MRSGTFGHSSAMPESVAPQGHGELVQVHVTDTDCSTVAGGVVGGGVVGGGLVGGGVVGGDTVGSVIWYENALPPWTLSTSPSARPETVKIPPAAIDVSTRWLPPSGSPAYSDALPELSCTMAPLAAYAGRYTGLVVV